MSQIYLHRIALGRSAYEPGDGIVPTFMEERPAEGHYIQQYDAKGNSFNPVTSAFNKSMRNAQNEALLLTGIVERKERADRHEQVMRSKSRSYHLSLLVDEHEAGEMLEYLFEPLNFLSHTWLEAMIKKIQIGAYPSRLSLPSVFRAENHAVFQTGQPIRLSLARRFSALGDQLSHMLVRVPLVVAVEQIIGRLQNLTQSKDLPREISQRIQIAISVAFEVSLVLVELAMLPLEFHSTAQALSLTPALPLFPRWTFIFPKGPASFHAFGWTRATSLFTSPAILLIINALLRNETAAEGFPICSFFTSFRWPDISIDPTLIPEPILVKDPVGWIMYRVWSTRRRFLQLAGWRIAKLNLRVSADEDLENDTLLDENDQLFPTAKLHRSTLLAHAPAHFLANAFDSLCSKIVLLPFESLMLRSVAFAITGPSPSTSGSGYYAPFGGPLSRLSTQNGLADFGAYASRLGLSLLAKASVDVVLFFGLCKLVRYVGTRHYGWGLRDEHQMYSEQVRLRQAEALDRLD